MIFPMESTFIFGSWICEVDHNGKLQGRLLEDSKNHEDLAIPTISIGQLARRFTRLTTSDST
jgi:hypothetical protein